MSPHFEFGESGRLVVEQLDVGDLWLVHERFTYWTAEGWPVIVPEHAVTDFASVPRVLWNLFPPAHHDYAAPAIVHDWLYGHHVVPRATADAIFREAMQVHGTPWVRWVIWAGVRLGGWWAYHAGPTRAARNAHQWDLLRACACPRL